MVSAGVVESISEWFLPWSLKMDEHSSNSLSNSLKFMHVIITKVITLTYMTASKSIPQLAKLCNQLFSQMVYVVLLWGRVLCMLKHQRAKHLYYLLSRTCRHNPCVNGLCTHGLNASRLGIWKVRCNFRLQLDPSDRLTAVFMSCREHSENIKCTIMTAILCTCTYM